MFDWDDLRHFAAFARDGSLSAAARRLGVDHATVARRIQALEAALDLKLVDRRARAHVLTAAGLRIAERARRMEDEAFAVGRAVRALSPDPAGTVSVSAPPGMANALIAPRLMALKERHPGIQVHLIGEKRTASLARREADLAVRLSRPEEAALVVRKVGVAGFGLYGSAAYLAAHPPEARSFIAYDENQDVLPQQRWLTATVGDRPIVLRASELESQRAAARAGLGLAVLPHFVVGDDPGLVCVEDEGAPASREIWLAVHRDLRRAPPVRAVMAFLAECLAQTR